MSNAFNKEEIVLFELLLQKFQPNNITAKQVTHYYPEMEQQERAGYTVWRPMPYVSVTEEGLDLTGKFKGLTQLSVPSTIDVIENVPWKLNAKELNDPLQRERKAQSGAQALGALIDRKIATLIGTTGSLVVTSASTPTGYEDIAEAEVRMLEEDIDLSQDRTAILNGRDWKKFSGDLASRETMNGKPTSAYERSYVGPVAGFDTFRTSFNITLPAAAGGTVTTGGSAQSHVPKATVPSGNATGASNVDNRGFDLTVDTTTNVAVGDAFTVAGVNAVSMIHKNDTGELRTFRVVEVVDATTLKIYPAPVVAGASQAEDEYANVSAPIPATTALTWVNTVAKPVNTFWSGESVEIIGGKLATPSEDMAGVATMRMSTEDGVEILFAKGGSVDDLTAKYRLTVFFGVTNLNPQMNGIMLFGQT